jgi:hypothetical protein
VRILPSGELNGFPLSRAALDGGSDIHTKVAQEFSGANLFAYSSSRHQRH